MNTKSLILFALFLICSPLQCQEHISAKIVRNSLKFSCLAIALYGVCYGTNWIVTRNKSVISNLKQLQNNDSQQITLFAHGIAATNKQALAYVSQKNHSTPFIYGNLYSYDYPDVTNRFWRVNFTKTALGQEYEVKGLQSAYKQLLTKNPDKQIVLMGMSRGAATILNFLAKHNPKNIKAVIVESPFDSTATVVKNMLQKYYLDIIPGMQTLGHCIMSGLFWQHSQNGMQPINSTEKIDDNLPILFVCSQTDTLIPAQSTIALYQKLKKSGYKKVHIFISKSGRHGKITQGNDSTNYKKALNAFYSLYELLHDKQLATEGMELLDVIHKTSYDALYTL